MNEHDLFENLMWFASIAKLFQHHRFKGLQNEKKLQLEIENLFIENNIPYEREVILKDTDIIDFMVGQVGIEVKIRTSVKDIYRQLQRYCDSDKFIVVILVTNQTVRLPRQIKGKYTYIINLGKAWL